MGAVEGLWRYEGVGRDEGWSSVGPELARPLSCRNRRQVGQVAIHVGFIFLVQRFWKLVS